MLLWRTTVVRFRTSPISTSLSYSLCHLLSEMAQIWTAIPIAWTSVRLAETENGNPCNRDALLVQRLRFGLRKNVQNLSTAAAILILVAGQRPGQLLGVTNHHNIFVEAKQVKTKINTWGGETFTTQNHIFACRNVINLRYHFVMEFPNIFLSFQRWGAWFTSKSCCCDSFSPERRGAMSISHFETY